MVDIVYPPVIVSALAWFKVLGLKFDVVGTEHIPKQGGAVLASNHVSYLDFIFVGVGTYPKRLVRFMAKDSVFEHKVSGPLMRGMKHIPVDRDSGAGSFDAALDALRSGEIVGVFPEATISRSFLIKDLKSGAARLAADADVPLIPMVTFGGQRNLSKGTPRSIRRGNTIAITIGKPMYPRAGDDPQEVTAQLRRRLSALLETTIARYPDLPRDEGDRFWMPATHGGTAPSLKQAQREDEEAAARRRARKLKPEAPADDNEGHV